MPENQNPSAPAYRCPATANLYSHHFTPNHFSFDLKQIPNSQGLIAVGGELSCDLLIESYSMGIFPWYEKGPIRWHSPEERMILFPDKFYRSKSFIKFFNKISREKTWRLTVDRAFDKVIACCAKTPRHGQEGTWINKAMIKNYNDLHKKGLAHSLEVWFEKKLIGGIYGLSLGRGFFGESMFSLQSGASKIALYALCKLMQAWQYHYIDCQVSSQHLAKLGAEEVPQSQFVELLKKSNAFATKNQKWTEEGEEALRLSLPNFF